MSQNLDESQKAAMEAVKAEIAEQQAAQQAAEQQQNIQVDSNFEVKPLEAGETSLLDVCEKPMPRCPLCAGHEEKSYNFIVLPTGNHMLQCACGLMSVPFQTRAQLEAWWRTRGGKKVVVPKISVKHGNVVQIPKEALADPVAESKKAVEENVGDPF